MKRFYASCWILFLSNYLLAQTISFHDYLTNHHRYHSFEEMKKYPDSVQVVIFDKATKSEFENFLNNVIIFKNLEAIQLSFIDLDSIPTQIANITSLKYMQITNCNLKSVKRNFNLPNLEYLDISYNKLNEIPFEISQLKKIQCFTLSYNKITTLPEIFSHLTSITRLFLDGNNLIDCKYLPPNLSELNVVSCKIANTNWLISKSSLFHSLQTLSMWDNKLTEIPNEFELFTNLLVLDIHFNQIQKIEADLSKLKTLKWLDLSMNQINKEEKERISNKVGFIKHVFL
jgi:Leucine-rich repeat (LRR) protein